MKKLLALVCAAAVALGLPGCGQKAESTPTSSLHQDAVLPLVDQADPEQAMEAIYAEVEIRDVQQADDQILLEKFFIDPSQLESYTVWYTSGLYGIADVFILKPLPGAGEQELAILREQLEQVKLNLSREVENYDIYNASQIVQEAPIFEQGGYLIMLMVEDTDAARRVIDQYIPK